MEKIFAVVTAGGDRLSPYFDTNGEADAWRERTALLHEVFLPERSTSIRDSLNEPGIRVQEFCVYANTYTLQKCRQCKRKAALDKIIADVEAWDAKGV